MFRVLTLGLSPVPTVVDGVPIPAWNFEPTELALPAPAGSYERVVSFNRASYSDFLSTSAAEVAASATTQLSAATAAIVSIKSAVATLQVGAGITSSGTSTIDPYGTGALD